MSELTPAQQTVIQKMRDGWEMKYSLFKGLSLWENGKYRQRVSMATVKSLLKKKLIVDDEEEVLPAYTLTEESGK